MKDVRQTRGAGVSHEGEQAVQAKAGEGGPHWGSQMFSAEIPSGFAAFMTAQRLVAVSGADVEGAPWCTVLTGDAGFVEPLDDRTISLPGPGELDPLARAFDDENDIGMVVMSPDTARRVRVNGRARRIGDRLLLRTEQVLGNCPKYLQIREVTAVDRDHRSGPVVRSRELTPDQISWVESADTFFIGSLSPSHGADASHRGGMPGFVSVTAPATLSWPDYIGNSFYMTLGNVELQPRAGLVFLDWSTGATLQLTGRCRVDWDVPRDLLPPGALRRIDFHIESVVHIAHASSLRWSLLGYSRFNPPTTSR
jgi:uncharacterized protein